MAGVHKELEAHLLAFNLVRLIILRAARQAGVELKRISFVNAVRTILRVSDRMREAPAARLPLLYRVMLTEIAAALSSPTSWAQRTASGSQGAQTLPQTTRSSRQVEGKWEAGLLMQCH